MRNLTKLPKPIILVENQEKWLHEFLADKTNTTVKYRYRHREIKKTLLNETSEKCVYCESKIGHNTPGDIEHKIPSSKIYEKHFEWENMTIACTECNRRKNAYYEEGEEFLDPYIDDVENLIQHYGPIVGWKNGDNRAEITVRILELNKYIRLPLISRKIEKIEELNNTIERYVKEEKITLKKLMKQKILQMMDKESEYSGMIKSIIKMKSIVIN